MNVKFWLKRLPWMLFRRLPTKGTSLVDRSHMVVSRRAMGELFVAFKPTNNEYVFGGVIGGALSTTHDVYQALGFTSIEQGQQFLCGFEDCDQFQLVKIHRKVIVEQGGPFIVPSFVKQDNNSVPSNKKEPSKNVIVRFFRGLWLEWKDNNDHFRLKTIVFCYEFFTLACLPFILTYNTNLKAVDIIAVIFGFGMLIPVMLAFLGIILLTAGQFVFNWFIEITNRGN